MALSSSFIPTATISLEFLLKLLQIHHHHSPMSSTIAVVSNPIATRSASLVITRSSHPDHDLRHSLSLNHYIEENPIAGVLYKWVNYGRGWKRRWFVLHDGVFSYYRIRGPHKISLAGEISRRSNLIGDDSLRFAHRHSNRRDSHSSGNPVGEIHLKVASICQNRSDMKSFTVFTGTKRLHLRAATMEDRTAWIDALQATKDMFPRMSNEELLSPTTNVSVSTDRLRQRLVKENVKDSTIEDCEAILRNGFEELRNEVEKLKHEHHRLLDFLKNAKLHIRTAKP